jgi:signal-transduction protein with cAMP-binding, CBS, and nucleotidyltransferase domain
MEFSEIFAIDFQTVKDAMDDPNKSATFETRVKCFDKYEKDMVISVSKVNISGKDGYIIVAKDLSRQKMMEKETELLSEQLQTSLLFMNYPIADFVSPYIKTGIDSTLEKSVDLMTRKNVPVFLVSGNDGSIVGMVTDSDLRKRVIQKKLDLSSPVAGVMTAPIHVISEKALLYEALLLFNREQLNYLCVKNDAGQVSGLLVKNDVLEFQVNATGYMLKEIEYAENVNTLKKIYNRIPPLVNALLESGAKTSNINRIITSVSDAVTCRIIDLAMEEMEQPLPCKFALMVMGSEGRMEQTLYTDQDNAIVFENVDEKNHEEVQEHFLKLAEKINFGLNEVGYNFCKGEIMAKNKKWCQALSGWKEYFSHWIHDGDPQSLLDASIFFDFRIVYGEKQFEKELYTHINKTIDNQAAFFHQLVQPVLNSRLPSATSGSNQVNIKKVLFPLTGFARVYALKNKVNRTNTLERLQKLHEKSVLQTSFFNETIQAYSFLMAFRFRFQSDAILKGELPDNLLDVDQLTDIERNTLKNVLSKLGELQTKLSFDFKGG